MSDFSKTYRRVPFFGIWAEDTADTFGARDAMAILAAAVEQCQDDDLRHRQDVLDALTYLEEHAGHPRAVGAFKLALDELHPVKRRNAAHQAYQALVRTVSNRIEVDP